MCGTAGPSTADVSNRVKGYYDGLAAAGLSPLPLLRALRLLIDQIRGTKTTPRGARGQLTVRTVFHGAQSQGMTPTIVEDVLDGC
ncbi:hypothetical protein [Sinomonas susongensis]|uniref:hypothetical protein n=1 Tax=Sinomonas susongensis TaxID=1324851 RepID=UPI00110A0757|nr:hypothetical protein [Sinomonas susongensis]